METLIKESILLVITYSFRDLISDHFGREHGVIQADMVLEKKLTVLYPDLQSSGRTLGLTWAFEITKPTPSGTCPSTRPHLLIVSQVVSLPDYLAFNI